MEQQEQQEQQEQEEYVSRETYEKLEQKNKKLEQNNKKLEEKIKKLEQTILHANVEEKDENPFKGFSRYDN